MWPSSLRWTRPRDAARINEAARCGLGCFRGRGRGVRRGCYHGQGHGMRLGQTSMRALAGTAAVGKVAGYGW